MEKQTARPGNTGQECSCDLNSVNTEVMKGVIVKLKNQLYH